MTLQISIVTAFQIGVYFWTINQEWFCSVSDNFPDCFVRNESGDIIRAKKGFHLADSQSKASKTVLKIWLRISVRLAAKEMWIHFRVLIALAIKWRSWNGLDGVSKMLHCDWSFGSASQNHHASGCNHFWNPFQRRLCCSNTFYVIDIHVYFNGSGIFPGKSLSKTGLDKLAFYLSTSDIIRIISWDCSWKSWLDRCSIRIQIWI